MLAYNSCLAPFSKLHLPSRTRHFLAHRLFIMGSILGRDVAPDLAPEYDVLGEGSNYEIRAYKQYLVAEVEMGTVPNSEDDRFRTLARVS